MEEYIPFELRVFVNNIDPKLDSNWQQNLSKLFNQIDQKVCRSIYKQILIPKNIAWDVHGNTFFLRDTLSLHDLVNKTTHSGMQNLGSSILSSLDRFCTYEDVTDIANYLESVLNQIDNVDVEEEIELKKTKQRIRNAFIYTIADLIQKKDKITVPSNLRNISQGVVKNFILEVFLKSEILEFAFKTIRPHQLTEQNYSVLSEYLVKEQGIRQLEVIKTSAYIFALAPVQDMSTNKFSIRRFLQEEALAVSSNIYVNGAFLALQDLDNIQVCENFKWQISRIVTIERNLSKEVLDLVMRLELYNTKTLRPLLFKNLDASGLSTDTVLQQRLWDFEQKLSIHILEPLYAMLLSVKHNDECEYLFISIQQILSDILSYFSDFKTQPVALFSTSVGLFMGRLTAYIQLLKKKRYDTFIVLNQDAREKNKKELSEAINILKAVCKDAQIALKTIKRDVKDKELALEKQTIFSKIFVSKQKKEEQISVLKEKAFDIRKTAYLDIVRIPKKYKNSTVYLEFEALISINDKERHYAFHTGENFIKRLPILVQLPEDKTMFNVSQVLSSIEFDLSKANQKWADTIKES